jgi:hypothetical protein
MRALRLTSVMSLIAGLVCSVVSSTGVCGGLFAPISMDGATVMPKGIRSVRLGGFTSEITDKYDGNGNMVPLANSFSKSVTWNQLIDSRPSAEERGMLRGGLKAEAIDLGTSVGDANGLVNTRITSTIPVFAYGLTEKITLGVGVPVVYAKTHVDTGWTANGYFQSELDKLRATGYEGKIQAFKTSLYDVVATKISSYGYKPLQDQETTDVGDTTLGLKIQVYKEDNVAVAIAPKVVVPTGRTPDIDKVVDVAPGDGHVSAGVGAAADFNVASKWTLTPSVGYTYQFENSQAVRIPRNGDESISPDIDYNVRKKVGDIMGTSAAVKYRINEIFSAATAYSFQYKQADSYIGGAFSPERYGYLERDTWQSMESAQAVLGLSTVPMFRRGAFAVPLDAALSYAHVFAGRNVGKIDLAVLELAAYF